MLKPRVFLAFLVLILVFATFVLGDTEDPERKVCKHQCRVQQGYDEAQKEECTRRCDQYHRQKQMREREGGGRSQHEHGEGEEEEEEQQQGQQGEGFPYVFQDHHFTTKIQTEHGRVRVLPKFTKFSKLLRGIENFRFAIFEAEPQTFVIPNHWDADAVLFVAEGRGTVSLVRHDRRESFNIRQGDVFRIPSGVTVYLINGDNNQRLIVAKLIHPVSTPGKFEVFFGAGENPFYRTFSIEILEAALNTRRDRLQMIFGQQRQGTIIKASQEQIQALSRHEEGGIWPFGGDRKGTINIFQQRPSQANEFGQLYVVDGSDSRELQELNLSLSFANITQGGMAGPMYYSKTTKIAVVVRGEGYFEMACPHLSSQHQGRHGSQQRQEKWGGSHGSQGQWGGGSQGQSTDYQRVSAHLRTGSVFIVPPGHPFVTVASEHQNLQVFCFEVNAFRNERIPLAGRGNPIRQLEKEAKELAFGVSARVVDEVFGNQEGEYFFRGPGGHQQQQGGRAYA